MSDEDRDTSRTRIMRALADFARGDSGAGSAELALISATVTGVALAAAVTVGSGSRDLSEEVGDNLGNGNIPGAIIDAATDAAGSGGGGGASPAARDSATEDAVSRGEPRAEAARVDGQQQRGNATSRRARQQSRELPLLDAESAARLPLNPALMQAEPDPADEAEDGALRAGERDDDEWQE